jgi:hypothetical protein
MTPEAAELLALQHPDNDGLHVLARWPRVPFLLQLRGDYGPSRFVLVHNAKVHHGGGLDALAAYLKDIDALTRDDWQPEDLLHLLYALQALPDDTGKGFAHGEAYFASLTPMPGLSPSLQRQDGALTFALAYPASEGDAPAGIAIGGNPHPGSQTRRFVRWTLHVSPRYRVTTELTPFTHP